VNIGPFFSSDAIGLTFAADQQFLETPGTLDAVWQLETDDCAPISLMSTLGLQARSFQIMPQISLNKIAQERIQDFFLSTLHRPGFLQLCQVDSDPLR